MKKFRLPVILVLFGVLVLYTMYLYSLRSNLVIWGDIKQDGLYFLAYYVYVLPTFIVLAILKMVFVKQNSIVKYSYYVYVVAMSVPSMIDITSQTLINTGVFVCVFVFILNIWEALKLSNVSSVEK